MIRKLVIENLSLVRGGRRLFEGLSFEIAAGEAVTLVGANGAGKTSLLRAIAGFVRPAAGEARFEGEAGAIEPEDARARDIHLCGHQDGLKPARTAREELLFQAQWTGGTEASALAASDRLGLGPLLDLDIRRLSAGQKRRLALARLVAAPRALWLLDEPLAPLDTARRDLVGGLMAEHLAGGGLIVAAVHDPLPIPARAIEVAG